MTLTTLNPAVTFDLGTRFRSFDPGVHLAASELVISRTIRDNLGMLHVVLMDLAGREISLFAEQFEAAVISGMLIPLEQPTYAFA
jgi:hypothetical protein